MKRNAETTESEWPFKWAIVTSYLKNLSTIQRSPHCTRPILNGPKLFTWNAKYLVLRSHFSACFTETIIVAKHQLNDEWTPFYQLCGNPIRTYTSPKCTRIHIHVLRTKIVRKRFWTQNNFSYIINIKWRILFQLWFRLI